MDFSNFNIKKAREKLFFLPANSCIYLLLILLFNSIVTGAASAISINDFKYVSILENSFSRSRLYLIPLKADILKKTRSDIGDLRLFTPENIEIPYVILEDQNTQEIESYRAETIDIKKETDSIDIILKMPGNAKPICELEFNILEEDFKKKVYLYGSDITGDWRLISEDWLYDFSPKIDFSKRYLRFELSSYSYYRVTIKEVPSAGVKCDGIDFSPEKNPHVSGLRISGITGRTSYARSGPWLMDVESFTAFKRELDSQNNTILTFEANLPCSTLSLETGNSCFFRNIKLMASETGEKDSFLTLAGGRIYYVDISGTGTFFARQDEIPVNTEKHRFYRVIIINGNNPPLQVQAIRLNWFRKNIAFISPSNLSFIQLATGNPLIKKPDYRINEINQKDWRKLDFEVLKDPVFREREVTFTENSAGKVSSSRYVFYSGLLICFLLIALVLYLLFGLKRINSRHLTLVDLNTSSPQDESKNKSRVE